MKKQVIVIRRDLNMRKGKMIAQACHASMKAILDKAIYYEDVTLIENNDDLDGWLFDGLFTKITLYVNSEQELIEIFNKAVEMNLYRALIKDAGKTEFHGVPTYTCCAIGPSDEEIIDSITGHLKLL